MTAKERMAIAPQAMPEQEPGVRARNMDEVALGYTAEMAKREASRCLNCPTRPCVEGCPVKIDIPGFLAAAAQGEFAKALGIIRESSLLPAVCGRVCPQERQCQKHCTVGKLFKDVSKAVAIGRVERFCADNDATGGDSGGSGVHATDGDSGGSGVHATDGDSGVPEPLPKETLQGSVAIVGSVGSVAIVGSGGSVAIVGSGPASITCAADCAKAGIKVTMFEAFHEPGGVLVYGIPEFRLPKRIVRREIENLKAMGVEVVTDFILGKTMQLTELKSRYDAVFIGTGAGLPKFMDIEGENLIGVFSANEYLTRANLMKAYREDKAATPFWHGKKVAVLGGGNVAMDAARMALRLKADEVHLIYRRSERELPARMEEVLHAKAEGVKFHLLENAKRILGNADGRVEAIECLRYELGAPDASGRRSPVAVAGSEFTFAVDTVVVAIGSAANPLIASTTPELKVDARGHVVVDAETMETSMPGVFAGGDIVQGAATVILAMGDGRKAAAGMIKHVLRGGRGAQ